MTSGCQQLLVLEPFLHFPRFPQSGLKIKGIGIGEATSSRFGEMSEIVDGLLRIGMHVFLEISWQMRVRYARVVVERWNLGWRKLGLLALACGDDNAASSSLKVWDRNQRWLLYCR